MHYTKSYERGRNVEIVDLIDTALMDSERWFPDKAHEPFFVAACMAGEAGEVINLMKKVERGTHTWTPEMKTDVAEEIADVFTYMLGLCGALEINLEEEYHKKRKANDIRFSARRALTEEAITSLTQVIRHAGPPMVVDLEDRNRRHQDGLFRSPGERCMRTKCWCVTA
jgi:NTP pyrophosphatase (non-canonical NTP hydrolase)